MTPAHATLMEASALRAHFVARLHALLPFLIVSRSSALASAVHLLTVLEGVSDDWLVAHQARISRVLDAGVAFAPIQGEASRPTVRAAAAALRRSCSCLSSPKAG